MANETAERESTEQFLNAEEAAKNLSEALQALMTETEGYAAAERTLHDSGERLVVLAGTLEELSGRSAEALEVVRAVGAPQIVDKLKAISPMLTAQGDLLATQSSQLTETRESLDRGLAGIQNGVDSVRSEMAEGREAQQTETETLMAAVSSLRSRMQLMMVSAIGLVVIVVILAIVLLVR